MSTRSRFRSQTRRRPSSVSNGSTFSTVRACGAIRSASPPVAMQRASAPSSPRICSTIAVDLAREAVDEPRLERGRGRLADHRRRLDEVDLDEPRRAREERVHRDLDPRREHAADVLARRRDDVEVRRGAEVDHDARRAVALAAPRPSSRSGRGRPRAGRRSGSGSRSSCPGRARAAAPPSSARPTPRTRGSARARSRRGRCRSRPSTSSSRPSMIPSSSPVRCASVATRQCSASVSPS